MRARCRITQLAHPLHRVLPTPEQCWLSDPEDNRYVLRATPRGRRPVRAGRSRLGRQPVLARASKSTGVARASESSADADGRIAPRRHVGEQLAAVLLVARQEGELDLGLPHRDVHPLPAVLHLDDVGPLLAGEPRQQRRELAGTVRRSVSGRRGSGPPASDRSARPGRAAVASMLPPERRRTPGPSPSTTPARSAATAAAPAPSTTSFDALEQQHDRLARSRSSVTVTTAVEALVEDRARERARLLDGDPVRDREAENGLARERSAPRRLHADDTHLRAQLPQRDRDAGGEPASADRHDDASRARRAAPRARPRSSPGRPPPTGRRTGGRARRRPRRRARAPRSRASSSMTPPSQHAPPRSPLSPRPSRERPPRA